MDDVKVVVCLFGAEPVYSQGCIAIARHIRRARQNKLDGKYWTLTVCYDDTVPLTVLSTLEGLFVDLKNYTHFKVADGERRTFWRYLELLTDSYCVIADADEPATVLKMARRLIKELESKPKRSDEVSIVGVRRDYEYGNEKGDLWMGGMLGVYNLRSTRLPISFMCRQYLESEKSRVVLHDNGLNKASVERYKNGYGHDELFLSQLIRTANHLGLKVKQLDRAEMFSSEETTEETRANKTVAKKKKKKKTKGCICM